MRVALRAATGIIALLSVSCGSPAPSQTEQTPCDTAGVGAALGAAQPGDVVRLGVCRIEGPIVVPSGVTLEGVAPGRSAIVPSAPGDYAVRVETGGTATTLRGLSLEGAATHVLAVEGGGEISLSNVAIVATQGTAVRIDGSLVVMRDVVVEGNDAGGIDDPTDATLVSVFGLRIVDSPMADLERVEVRRFARIAVSFEQSIVRWTEGQVGPTRRTGLYVDGGSTRLSSLAIEQALPSGDLEANAGAFFARDADVEGDGLVVERSGDVGILVERATFRGRAVAVRDSAHTGIRASEEAWLELSGGSSVSGSRGVGIESVGAVATVLRDVSVAATSELTTAGVDVGALARSDGISIARPAGRVVLEGLDVSGSSRVDLVLSIPDAFEAADLVLSNVSVAPLDAGFGALRVGPDDVVRPIGRWDEGVSRPAAVAARDASAVGTTLRVPQ